MLRIGGKLLFLGKVGDAGVVSRRLAGLGASAIDPLKSDATFAIVPGKRRYGNRRDKA